MSFDWLIFYFIKEMVIIIPPHLVTIFSLDNAEAVSASAAMIHFLQRLLQHRTPSYHKNGTIKLAIYDIYLFFSSCNFHLFLFYYKI